MSQRKQLLAPAILIAAAVFWIYAPVIRGEWLWDDKELISQNELIHDPRGWWKIWAEPGSMVDYYPLLSSMEWIEWRLFHQATWGYHLVNIFLHLLGAFLVWRLLSKLGLELAWLGGLLFAIHPVQVESVAWIAELKNTLSLPPFLLAVCSYLDFDEKGRRGDYLTALGLFIVAMLCKTTMVMFPVIILLHAWWKRGRIQIADLKASAPFFSVSLVLGLVTVWFQQHHAIRDESLIVGDFFSRLALAGTSASFYFLQVIWPVGLLPVYPKWNVDPPSALQVVPWIVGTVVFIACWFRRATWGRHVLLGLGFFLVNLLPFVGLTNAFYLSFSWVLDHVLYLPLIGLVGLFTAALGAALEQRSASVRLAVVVFIAVVFPLLAWESHWYAGKFFSQPTLWAYTLERNPDAWPAHVNLGNYLYTLGRDDEAMEHFRHVIRTNPRVAPAHNNLGNGYLKKQRYAEAIEQYQIAIEVSPGYEQAHQGLALALARTGRYPEAMEQNRLTLAINPNNRQARQNYADLLLQAGHASEAAEQYEILLHNDPHYGSYRDQSSKPAPGNK